MGWFATGVDGLVLIRLAQLVKTIDGLVLISLAQLVKTIFRNEEIGAESGKIGSDEEIAQ
jgi:hypothetical protein